MLLDRFNSPVILKWPKASGDLLFVNRASAALVDRCQIKQAGDTRERHYTKFIEHALFERMDEEAVRAGHDIPEREDMFVNLNDIVDEQANSLDNQIHAT